MLNDTYFNVNEQPTILSILPILLSTRNEETNHRHRNQSYSTREHTQQRVAVVCIRLTQDFNSVYSWIAPPY